MYAVHPARSWHYEIPTHASLRINSARKKLGVGGKEGHDVVGQRAPGVEEIIDYPPPPPFLAVHLRGLVLRAVCTGVNFAVVRGWPGYRRALIEGGPFHGWAGGPMSLRPTLDSFFGSRFDYRSIRPDAWVYPRTRSDSKGIMMISGSSIYRGTPSSFFYESCR